MPPRKAISKRDQKNEVISEETVENANSIANDIKKQNIENEDDEHPEENKVVAMKKGKVESKIENGDTATSEEVIDASKNIEAANKKSKGKKKVESVEEMNENGTADLEANEPEPEAINKKASEEVTDADKNIEATNKKAKGKKKVEETEEEMNENGAADIEANEPNVAVISKKGKGSSEEGTDADKNLEATNKKGKGRKKVESAEEMNENGAVELEVNEPEAEAISKKSKGRRKKEEKSEDKMNPTDNVDVEVNKQEPAVTARKGRGKKVEEKNDAKIIQTEALDIEMNEPETEVITKKGRGRKRVGDKSDEKSNANEAADMEINEQGTGNEKKHDSTDKTELIPSKSSRKRANNKTQKIDEIMEDKNEDMPSSDEEKSAPKRRGGKRNAKKEETTVDADVAEELKKSRKRKNAESDIVHQKTSNQAIRQERKKGKPGKAKMSEDDEVVKKEKGIQKELKVVLKRESNIEECVASTEVEREPEPKRGRGRGKIAAAAPKKVEKNPKTIEKEESETSDGDFKQPKNTKSSTKESKSTSKKEKIPDVTVLDFGNESVSPSGKPWNLKLSSWNINGVRAWLEKDGLAFLHHEKPDVMCVQETKCPDVKLPEDVTTVAGYHAHWLSGDKDGYSGIGILSKEKPLNVQYGIGVEKHDNEGRVITAEYDTFTLVTAYVPNSGRGLVRLEYRQQWDEDFLAYLKKLDEKKPVILCGDLNVAHEEIDIANPKTNKKNAGFTKEEREGFSTLLSEGFIDTFRHLYPDQKAAYTFWTYMMNARAKNVGWRLDYFLVSKRFTDHLCDSVIRKDVFGSDHCPVTLFLSV